MPTLSNMLETIKAKIAKYGPESHCNPIFVAEELRKNAIANKADETGRRKTRVSLETYSPEAYSEFNAMLEFLMERTAFNPQLVVDLLLLLVQEARGRTEGENTDGISIALASLFSLKGDYESRLRESKEAYRKRRVK